MLVTEMFQFPSLRSFDRLIWVLIVLGVSAGFFFLIYHRVNKYLQYNKNVNVEIEYRPSIDFPAVTICNQNFLR